MSEEAKLHRLANPAFRFVVAVDGQRQAAFTECKLPDIEWEVEQVKEGGLNTFVHQLPGQRKPGKIALQNGVGKSALVDWYIETLGGKLTRKSVTVTLLDAEKETVMVWHLHDAFPTKWSGPQLKSDSQAIAIEMLELACGEITASYE